MTEPGLDPVIPILKTNARCKKKQQCTCDKWQRTGSHGAGEIAQGWVMEAVLTQLTPLSKGQGRFKQPVMDAMQECGPCATKLSDF